MAHEPMMFSSIAPPPLFSPRHYPSKQTDTYASSYLDSSSSPYLNTYTQPKRHSHQQYSPQSPRKQHARSSSLQHYNYWQSSTPAPNLSKPLPPPPPQSDSPAAAFPDHDSVLAMILDVIPSSLPQGTPARPSGNMPMYPKTPQSPRVPPSSRIPQSPRVPPSPRIPQLPRVPQSPSEVPKLSLPKRKDSLRNRMEKPSVPSTIIEIATPPIEIRTPPPMSSSPSPFPSFTITRSQRHKRQFYTYTPANLSTHPTYTLLQETDHLFQVRRNASPIAEIKSGLTGHHAKVAFSSKSEHKTEIERRGNGHGHDYHYPVEITTLGQTCDWRREDGGRFVLRDECIGTIVAKADIAAGGKVDVVIEASEAALDEVMVSYMVVSEIHREEKDESLTRSVVEMIGNVI